MKAQAELFDPIKPKRKKPVQLTGRSRKYLEANGYVVALVERSIDVPKFPGSTERFKNKFDAFGFADLAAIHPQKTGTLWVQVTDHKHRAEHEQKILEATKAPVILQAGNRIQLHTWKAAKRQGLKIWNLRIQSAQLFRGTVEFGEITEHWFRDNGQEIDDDF